MDLLERVVAHKLIFFRAAWKQYETAVPGSFHLVPSEGRMADLRSDYAQMKAMIFGDYPEWKTIIEGLRELEDRINNRQLIAKF